MPGISTSERRTAMRAEVAQMEAARPRDARNLVELRDRVAESLVARGIQQWIPGEFTERRMQEWVDDGRVFVLRRSGRPVAAVAVLWSDREIWGQDDDDAGYIHLLMVDPDLAGNELGASVLLWAEQFIERAGRSRARLDAVSSNDRLQQWYAERGYDEVGTKSFGDEDWFATTLREKAL